jgi:hypothetical protein
MFRVLCRAILRSRNLLPVPLFGALAWGVLCGLAAPASAALGQWTPQNQNQQTSPPTNFTEIHMALLPGDGSPYHSRILAWEDSGGTKGAELGWTPGAVGCATPPYTLPVLGTWHPGAEIFCGGHAQLANGELIKVGGHEFGLVFGIPDSRTFAPGTLGNPGSWTARPLMQQARFYPTITTLADGRALVTGGLRDQQAWFFGGRVNGSPPATGTGDLLHRYGRGTGAGWDPLVTPLGTNLGERPTPREGHSTAYLFDLTADVYFGGKDGASNPINDGDFVWLLRREDGATLDADYTYRWEKRQIGTGSPIPAPRSEHTAVAVSLTEMIVFGGTQTAGQGFWRLYKDGSAWRWQTVAVTSGTGPTARFGHAAVYQTSQRRMIVFGGSDQSGGTATDGRVFAFTFPPNDFTQGSWSELAVAAGPAPKPRRDHIMVLDPTSGPSLLVYSGQLGGGASSDTLWRLNLSTSPAVWSQVATAGPSPGPRANHAAFYDDGLGGGRLFINGGEPAPRAAVDKFAYIIDPFPSSGPATWVRGAEAPSLLSGHTAERDPVGGGLHARLPEIYTANSWSAQSNSGWLPAAPVVGYYPVQFLVPGSALSGGGGRLIRVGPDPIARYLDLPATGLANGWQLVPNGDNLDLYPQTGVMYEPGKIMVAGDEVDHIATAKTFDALAMGPAGWVPSPGWAPRYHSNLVILPTGQVLSLGGLDPSETAVRCPQLWTPGAGTNPGTWTAAGSCPGGGCALECEPVVRNYHSTAMLLPDARVLTGGGNVTGTETQLHVFCPPYLFDAGGGPAPRPQINTAPSIITYGEAFIIGKSSDVISSVCLIRPAATTHAFDQNQRFVPLTFETLGDNTGLRAVAPSSGSHAPPGYYLLFILNQNGVPAVARWVRLGNCPTIPCDTGSPPPVVDLYADIVSTNEIWLAWSAPGDDYNPALGAYDLRFATSSITSENDYATATPVPVAPPDETPPTPGPLGSAQNCAKFNLWPCTPYHFALKTRDGNNNWSARGVLSTSTMCGGGGGGFSARRVDGGAEVASAAVAGSATVSPSDAGEVPLAEATALAPAAGALVAETRRTPEGGWQVILRMVSEPEGLDPALAGAIVSQVRDASGGWKTLGRYQPSPGQSPLGLCALRDQGRVVFPAGFGLDRVVSGVRAGAQDFALSLADHSRLGSLGGSFLASGGGVEMALGDALTMSYAPSGEALPGAAGWYLLVRPTGSAGPSATPARREPVSAIPTRFALYQNQPNPFRRSTTIAFDLPVTTSLTLEVFDLLGRKVATLTRGELPAGAHTVDWDLRDAGGAPVRSGVYIYRLVAGEFRARRKMGVLP